MEEKLKSRTKSFVEYVISRSNKDSAFRAAFKKAENPQTKYDALEYLINFCDIENKYEYEPFLLIGFAIAKAKLKKDGDIPFGLALLRTTERKNDENNPAKLRLRRILSCSDIDELVMILRPAINLIISKQIDLNYSDLLYDILNWNYDWKIENTKIKWAKDFYKGGKNVSEFMEDRN